MMISLSTDPSGRYVCELVEADEHATVTASNVPDAGDDLLAALEDARDNGLGESLWVEPGGEYRWMFKRDGSRLTVAVMWCSGTVTGWQHVFRSECDFDEFLVSARSALDLARSEV